MSVFLKIDGGVISVTASATAWEKSKLLTPFQRSSTRVRKLSPACFCLLYEVGCFDHVQSKHDLSSYFRSSHAPPHPFPPFAAFCAAQQWGLVLDPGGAPAHCSASR